ncbi:hypothetical protein A2333_00555 [Candidatus Wolfebacteria bacterium RIFOXYB2_FULL_49_7]|uniref:SET domain-containing protein n=1 Tax=Candidatus Wolfebacteria bacterium RIFOXYB1_FULL_54_12 TaxID=1802559 RepID=A0A1F8DWJ7_9BACT|nr:MAG: hypothetical protein A2333_00555 [Candidatus Wolfebacteria bacterium RIFOXYB2_FULL_49_7]OGM92944.1 MAG: hypothetical protein A2372_03805 [Candidatus Wolfebacteria bacterium RIFOXYB1_FULL_54_12]
MQCDIINNITVHLTTMQAKKSTTSKPVFAVKRSRAGAGLGLFATADISKGTFIIEYTGEKIANAEADRRGGRYLFNINTKWTIDGKGHHNTARYINHSCRPNCESRVAKGKVTIHSIKNIKSGEELSYDYGTEYFKEYIKPLGCRCDKCHARRIA